MQNLLDVFGFLSVLLRGLTLSFQSLLLGGIAFRALVWSRIRTESQFQLLPPMISLIRVAALGLTATQLASVSMSSAILMDTTSFRLRDIAGANFFIAGVVSTVCALLLIIFVTADRDFPTISSLLVLAILLCSVVTSHAWARVDHRLLSAGFTLIHYLAAGIWIGALPFLLIALRHSQTLLLSSAIARTFSSMAASSVAVVLLAGGALTFLYMDSPSALYGTSWGAMLGAKIWLVGGILCIGALNFSIVRNLGTDAGKGLRWLRWLVEAEIGIGFTAIVAAASLGSQPPAIDLPNGRVTAHDLVQRFTPRFPRLSTPALGELSKSDELLLKQEAENQGVASAYIPGTPALRPSTPGDIAWSEYNHHWAGIVVLCVGLLAFASQSGKAEWAKHWPLLFLALAVFLFIRADAENWPLGPNGFWESFRVADVLQHRFFTFLVLGFAILEWRVKNGRNAAWWAPYVFPAVCALGGAVLLTHSHSVTNVKEATLIDLSHIPIAVLAVFAGWARWLEVRAHPVSVRLFSWIWPLCFVAIGTTLMLYREA
ncbi:MAG TPA: CopD family protein [Terriglobales bacterium]|nr:CopD family protein [Terriglobales bacterium]